MYHGKMNKLTESNVAGYCAPSARAAPRVRRRQTHVMAAPPCLLVGYELRISR